MVAGNTVLVLCVIGAMVCCKLCFVVMIRSEIADEIAAIVDQKNYLEEYNRNLT